MLAFALLFVACHPGSSGSTGDTAGALATAGTLRVLTYNVHGLPSAITGDDTAARMEAIAPLLADWDLVGLQEDFEADNHELLVAESDHATQLVFDEVLEDHLYGSGLAILAHAPLVEQAEVHYSTCHGVFDSASDCLASKGIHLARLQVGAATLDFWNTHHEAGGDEEDVASRETQVQEALAALDAHSSGRAILFTGDFNLGDDPEDEPAVEAYRSWGLVDACDAVGCPEPGRIDRLWFAGGEDVALEVRDWWLPEDFVDAGGEPLSDHDPIGFEVAWQVESSGG